MAAEGDADAAAFIEEVNAAYEAMRDRSRRVVVRHRTRTQWPGKLPTTTTAVSIIHQKGHSAHVETLPGLLERPPIEEGGEPYAGPSHNKLVWAHDAEAGETRAIHVASPEVHPGGLPHEKVTRLRHGELPKDLQTPLSAAEIPDELAGAAFTLEDAELGGEPVKLLKSAERIAIQPDTEGHFRIWVDPNELLIRRVETDLVHTMGRESGTPEVKIESVYDIHYEFDVPIDDDMFEIPLKDDHVDVTEYTKRELERTGRMQAE